MTYDLIIFDWDGTLVDSTQRIVDSMQRAAREVGLPVVADSAIQNIIGLGLPEALKTVWPTIQAEQVPTMTTAYARFFVSESQIHMDFFDGVPVLLDTLTASGRQLAVATGKSRKGLDRMLRDMQIGSYFAATRCADETRSKPHPQMLHELLQELNVAPERALMVGDTSYDLDMANAAGMHSIAMSHGAHNEQVLLACRPQAICHSIHELNQWIHTHG